jgi:lysozyme
MTITQAKADELLKSGVESFVSGVNKILKRTPTQNQFDAMVSLCYNIGVGAFQGSTLIKKFNAGDTAAASEQFLVWNKAGGSVSNGRTNRRKDEKALFDKK